jgi:zona occludens toxin
MTISAYTGLPGHGKSYGVVENVIRPALESKRVVYTNIPMNKDVCEERFQMSVVQFDIQDIIDNENWWSEIFEAGSILVLDEVWRLWPAGLTASKARHSDKEFLAEHRHLVGDNGASTEIVLVTQDLSQIATFARALVETTFRVTKHSSLGASKFYRVDVYYGAVTGASPPISKRTREIQGKFSKKTYALYKSHTKSEVGAGDETRTDNRFNILKGASVKFGIAFIVIGLFVGFAGLQHVANYFGTSEEEQKLVVEDTNQPSGSDRPVLKVEKIEPNFKFLSQADEITISWNNGHFPRIEYLIDVVIDDMTSTLTLYQLSKLDYKVEAINQCLIKITGFDFSGVAMCKPQKFKKENGLIDGVIDSTTMDTQQI